MSERARMSFPLRVLMTLSTVAATTVLVLEWWVKSCMISDHV